MAQPAVVITFTSRCGTTEDIAHAAAVGTVNARTLPRLRRLPDDDGAVPSADCQATLQRMKRDYVPPSEADISGSSALIVVPSSGMTPASAAWQPFMAMLDRLAAQGQLAGKRAAVIDNGDPQAVAAFATALAGHGFTIVPGEALDPRSHGRAVGAIVLAAAAHPA